MCGRYYVDDDTAKEIEKLVQSVDEKMKRKVEEIHLQPKDIHPAEIAPVITADNTDLCCKWQRWGFPGFNGKQLIFNARSESALEKKMFKESVEHRRVVIPAAWFYEWNKNKEKNIFYLEGQSVLYMAGLYNRYQNEDCFVILTTAANESMIPVHDRMPLLLERDDIGKWLFEDQLTEAFLQKTPPLLGRRADYEQMSLFPVENTK
ncbi:MAG: SOS response-associated peptidase [Lachnospiraceae bacterium]|nr:SOS response-associated peptidase [Lachnospiraceae bacterium]